MVSITAFVLCHYIAEVRFAGLVPDPQIDGTVRDTSHQAGNHMSDVMRYVTVKKITVSGSSIRAKMVNFRTLLGT